MSMRIEDVTKVKKAKKELKELFQTVDPIIKYFNRNASFPEQIMVKTLLQNATFGDVNQHNVNSEWEKIEHIYSLIFKVADYIQNDHVINFILKEYDAIIICIIHDES